MATTTTTTTTQEQTAINDPWTPDQELTLLKALVSFKPVGLHAHFRMLSIHQYLLNSGTCSPEDTHTRIPGIWAKLRTLYDLERLDEREDVVITTGPESKKGNDDDDDDDDEEAVKDDGKGNERYWKDFELLGGRDVDLGRDLEGLMWERRLAPEGTPGSAADEDEEDGGGGGTGRGRRRRRESTVAGTDEPRSSPAPGSTRGTRGGRRGRVAKLKDQAEVGSVSEGRSSRRESKAASEVGTKDDDGDEVMDDAEEDEEESATADEDGDAESEEHEEDEKRPGPVRRGRGGRRGRGRRGRRRG